MSGHLVVVVGDVINDVVVLPLEEPVASTDTASRVRCLPGGSGANQAAWMAALGASVRFVGRAGAPDAELHKQALASLGIDARIGVEPELPTGTIVVLVSPDGERSMFTDRGASAALGAADLPGDLLSGAAMLHVSGYQLFGEQSRAAVRRLWDEAGEQGLARSVDPASLSGLAAVGAEAFLRWTEGARLIFPNLDEGRFLTGEHEPEPVLEALLCHYETVVLKVGGDGVLCGSRIGGRVRLPAAVMEGAAPGIATVVDSTGAGDAFLGGFVAELVGRAGARGTSAGGTRSTSGTRSAGEVPLGASLGNTELEGTARAGLKAAAIAVSQLGGRPPPPNV
ncbi:MAG: carbohydrate kinase family protein [Acidimicrobiales bacterium]